MYKPHCCFALSILELHEARRAETFLLALSITSGFTFTNKGLSDPGVTLNAGRSTLTKPLILCEMGKQPAVMHSQ